MFKIIFFILFNFIVIFSFGQLSLQGLVGNQTLHSSYLNHFDFNNTNANVTYNFSLSYGLFNQNWLLDFGYRNQNISISRHYISIDHKNTDVRYPWWPTTFYEYGSIEDVVINFDTRLYELNIMKKIIKGLYLGVGVGISHNKLLIEEGVSSSRFHYYNIDLSGIELDDIFGNFITTNLQYRLPFFKRFNLLFNIEYQKHSSINLTSFQFTNIKQHSFIAEAGISYRLF